MDKYTTEEVTKELIQSSKLPEPLHLAAMLEQTLQSPLHGKAADCLREMYAQAQAAKPTTKESSAVQPAPVQPVAFFDPQEKGFYWAKPTKVTAPLTGAVEPMPLYTTTREIVCSTGLCHYRRPQEEPFGYFRAEPFGWTDCAETDEGAMALYEHPTAQRPWVGLTVEDIIDVIHPLVMADMPDEVTDYEIARAIEAKLKEKNT